MWKKNILFSTAFHSTQTRLNNIGIHFPELASINEKVWRDVYQEIHYYYLRATYILVDLQQSYEVCWRIHMTKRCAQILLKYESKAVVELYETGILGEAEHSHILRSIEKKQHNLEFYRVRMPKYYVKEIENSLDLLELFRSLPIIEKVRWRLLMKSKHRWFQPDKILLRKGQRVTTAYLITRGMIKQQVDTTPIFYRSGNIVGIDALFSQTLTIHDTYCVSKGTLLEAYCIDNILLDQLLNDTSLAPSVYCEIALNVLSNHYQARLKPNRSQLRMILRKHAKFYWNQPEQSIQLKENDRLFILAGYVTRLLNGCISKWDSIELQIVDEDSDFVFNPSTVAYTWTDEDEVPDFANHEHTVQFPLQAFGSVMHDVLYPGHSAETMDLPRQHNSTSLLDNMRRHNDVHKKIF